MPAFPSFVGGSYPMGSLIANGERTVNLYSEALPEGSAAHSALLPTPGFTLWSPTVADVGTRTLFAARTPTERMFGVVGASLYEWDTNGTSTNRGAVSQDANPAQMVYNGIAGGQLGICSGGNFYYFTLSSNVLTQVAALNGIASMVAYAGGYAFVLNQATGIVRESALNDFSTFSGAVFFQRSLFADPCQTIFTDANNLLWMLGTESFEARYNTGTGTQPWAPLSGLQGLQGSAAPFAFAPTAIGNFWLARNAGGLGQLVTANGASPQPLSTYGVNAAIATYLRTSRIDNVEILPYQQEGHTFINVHFPSVPATWTYDVEGQGWAERGEWNIPLGRYDLWAPRSHVVAFGKHIVGDRTTGKLWTMDTNVATGIDGAGIRRLRRSPHLNHEHQRIPIDQFEILMDVGLGLASGQGSDPKAMLRVSQDGGRTYGNERQASVGRIGEYRKRVYWTRLGAAPDAVMEVTYTEPTPFRIVDAFVNNMERAA